MNKPFKSQMTSQDVEILKREVGYQGHFSLEIYTLKHRLFAGGWSHPLSREIFVPGQAAGAVLFDPDLDKVVLIEQFRIGALNSSNPWLLEIVAGMIAPEESSEEVVRRESIEEAGMVIQEIIPIYEYWVSPGGTMGKLTLFCGRVDASKAGGIHGLEEESEDIKVHVLSTNEAYEALETGVICNAASIIALQWLKLNENSVKAQWSRS